MIFGRCIHVCTGRQAIKGNSSHFGEFGWEYLSLFLVKAIAQKQKKINGDHQ